MKTITPSLSHKRIWICGAAGALLLASVTLGAQSPAARIQAEIDSSQLTPIRGSEHALAGSATDMGRMQAGARISGITLRFNRSAAQEAALDALMAAQQNPASPQYHQWLTPDQFAARFGVAQSDMDKVQSWLQQQGFAIDGINRSHTAIHFSGSAAQVESAFATGMHYFKVSGEKHFAPSTALSVPASVAPVVADIHNLDDFRPHPDHVILHRNFTSGQSGNVFFGPGDIYTAYDVNTTNMNGAGQTIAIMGQSAVTVTDIENFESAAGLTKKDPNLILVPGTGASTSYSGDESESDLDLEWSGAMAPGASVVFVYTGNNGNYGTYDSADYAVDEGIGNIISMSYSTCELDPFLTSAYVTSQEAIYKQAAAQGQTVLAASGDQGSTSCYGDTNISSTATQESLAVNYPASSAYITSVGGTEIASEYSSGGSSIATYWKPASGSDVYPSLLSYVPEVAWNDDAANASFASSSGTPCSIQNPCLSSSGGGASTLIAQPSWQTAYFGATGEANPDSKHRLVPDIAFYSSPGQPGYLYCTSDNSAWGPSQTGSCGAGFRASSSDVSLTVAGGTSFATPIFAGMVALLNENSKYITGAGEINNTLYTLAASSSLYGNDFHDVTSGNNDCQAPANCNGTANYGYAAGTGYDEVTGLGSVDVGKLAHDWPAAGAGEAALIGTSVSVSAANATPPVNQNDVFTITVTDDSGNPVTTGTVTLQVDGGTSCGGLSDNCGGTTVSNQSLSASGQVTYTATFATSGAHSIVAQYSGDAAHGASTGAGSVDIAVASSGKGSISAAATPSTLTVAQGSSGTETITVTPSGGYTGTVLVNIDFGSADSALSNLCAGFSTANTAGLGEIQITGTQPGSVTLTLDANGSDCSGGAMKHGMGQLRNFMKGGVARNTPPAPARNPLPPAAALAGLLLIGFLGRRSRSIRNLVAVLALAAAGLLMSACGSSVTTPGVANPPKGTYTGTITATDSATSSLAAKPTTFQFVID
ncbi:MAG TPA: protease pro-enzyme activation domain-containing protein [Terracidiphilus sp.]|jgi:subtilase family serine protease|nr:protease pro-enzyme activation domain-containing protein [Terracidiphilus sp.]